MYRTGFTPVPARLDEESLIHIKRYEVWNMEKVRELEETGQIGATKKGSLSFQLKPAGGANWTLACSIADSTVTALLTCNKDVQEKPNWSVTADVSFAVGAYPSQLNFEKNAQMDFDCTKASQSIIMEIPKREEHSELIGYCKIRVKVENTTGLEDQRCWWHYPVERFMPSDWRYIIIKKQKFYNIFDSPYLEQLRRLNPDLEGFTLHGISIQTFILLHNYTTLVVKRTDLLDASTIDILVDGIMYFETAYHIMINTFYVDCFTKRLTFDIRRFMFGEVFWNHPNHSRNIHSNLRRSMKIDYLKKRHCVFTPS